MTNQQTSGGVSTLTVLVLIFMTLKLTDNIAWSWWWVFSPYWLAVVLIAAFVVVAGLFGAVASVLGTMRRNRRLARQAAQIGKE